MFKISPNSFLVYIFIQVADIFFSQTCQVEALNCYTCTSKEDVECTPLHPSGEAIPAEDCNSPDTLLNNWILSDDFLRAAFHDFEVDNLFNLTANNEENAKRYKLIEVAACAYFYASSGNLHQTEEEEEDEDVDTETQSSVNVNELLTVRHWVMRDCVTLTLQEQSKENANHCLSVSGTEIANVRFCTCATDNCNKPNDIVQTFISDEESSADFLKSRAILTFVMFTFNAF